MTIRLIGLTLLALYPLCSQQGPSTAEVFGPGVLSVGEVFRGSFTPDGNVFYFFKKIGSGEDYRIIGPNMRRINRALNGTYRAAHLAAIVASAFRKMDSQRLTPAAQRRPHNTILASPSTVLGHGALDSTRIEVANEATTVCDGAAVRS